MSSGGQVAGGVIGAVAGFFIGGPAAGLKGALYGAQIGIAVGGYLDPPKGPVQQGPRLADLTVQTSTYGAFIPRGYGTFPVTGNVFWLENNQLTETVNEESTGGGKGGGSSATTETFSYSATFAIGLLDCTDGVPITGIRRIWISKKPFADYGSTELSAVLASNQASQFFTLHKGELDQAPDERMQATLGIANTPAYRGLAYIVFKDLPLAPYGNSLVGAQITVEVVKAGAIAASFVGPSSTPPIRNIYGETLLFFKDRLWLVGGRDQTLGGIINTATMVSDDGVNFYEYASNYPGSDADDSEVLIFNDEVYVLFKVNTKEVWKTSDMVTWTYVATATAITGAGRRLGLAACVHDGKMWIFGGESYGGEHADAWSSPDGVTWTLATSAAGWHSRFKHKAMSYAGKLWVFQGYSSVGGTNLTNDIWNSDDGITWTFVSTVPSRTAYPYMGAYGYEVVEFHGGVWFVGGALTSGTFSSYCLSTNDFITFVQEPISPSWPVGAYVSATLGWSGTLFVHGGSLPVVHHYVDPISSDTVSLDSIVNTECLKSSLLTSGDIDTSLLTQLVRGYRIGSVAAIRAGLEPPQGAWPFDVIQHGYMIKFKPRGSASVATIPASDLDARQGGEAPGVALTTSREMDSVLPQRVTLDYMDIWRAYDAGQQYAERLNTDSVNIRALDLAIVLNADEAAGIVETLLYLYWLERYDVSFSLPPTYGALEPADVLTLNTEDTSYSLRLTGVTYTQDGRLECSAKYNNAVVYVPAAIGEEGQSTGAVTIALAGGTVFAMLDIPLMADIHNITGYLMAMKGYLSSWPGGVLYRSDDAGQTWTNLQAIQAPGAMFGRASNVISTGNTALMDKSNRLSVRFYGSGPSSVTELAMLNGANYFAYGTDGRWEIIGAQTCTLESDGSYTLQDLLRGRQGTEWAMTTHAIGDKVIALDTNLAFVTTSSDAIGLSKTYRAVTVGALLDSTTAETHTYSGVNLECLSPVYLGGSRHPTTNDWTLTWIRRTRIGGEWRDYVDATLGEASKLYDVEIYSSGTYNTLKRTFFSLTSETTTYTSAEQVADFGSNQSTLYVKVYQISATVGRGYPLTTSITR